MKTILISVIGLLCIIILVSASSVQAKRYGILNTNINGFDSGFAKAQHDSHNNQTFSNTCILNTTYCIQFHYGYIFGWGYKP